MKKNKTYRQETIEFYVFSILFMTVFFATIFISGHLTGTDWIGLFQYTK